jgi:hypothetical protein
LIIGGITAGNGEIVVFDVNIDIREDELLFNGIPDNSIGVGVEM